MATSSTLQRPFRDLVAEGASPFLEVLSRHRAVQAPGFLDAEQCAACVAGINAGRAAWNADFGGEQFSLGRAYYTHLETDRSHEYFEHADQGSRDVERFVPGLAGRMIALVGELTRERARQRRGWGSPGIHIFPVGQTVAKEGGVVHFDLEGLPERHRDARAPAFTLVLMLQPPANGGGLRVWDRLYDGVEDGDPGSAESAIVEYSAGDLVAIDSYRLHQILPFEGPVDRISMTAHVAKLGSWWEAWF